MEYVKKSSSCTTLLFTQFPGSKDENKSVIKEIKLKMPKKVKWAEDTIFNENMSRKNSKSKN